MCFILDMQNFWSGGTLGLSKCLLDGAIGAAGKNVIRPVAVESRKDNDLFISKIFLESYYKF